LYIGILLIEIDLKLGDRAIDLFAEGHAIELVEDGLMEPLGDAIGLRQDGRQRCRSTTTSQSSMSSAPAKRRS
jgi:hypothetical protein